MAEAVRFELTVPLRGLLFSRQVQSTTLPRLQAFTFGDADALYHAGHGFSILAW